MYLLTVKVEHVVVVKLGPDDAGVDVLEPQLVVLVVGGPREHARVGLGAGTFYVKDVAVKGTGNAEVGRHPATGQHGLGSRRSEQFIN